MDQDSEFPHAVEPLDVDLDHPYRGQRWRSSVPAPRPRLDWLTALSLGVVAADLAWLAVDSTSLVPQHHQT